MYQIISMCEKNVPRIAALEAANFSAPWDEASIRAELENPLALWLIAEGEAGEGEERPVLGYVVFSLSSPLRYCSSAVFSLLPSIKSTSGILSKASALT